MKERTRKLVYLLSAAMLITTLTACGNGASAPEDQAETSQTNTAETAAGTAESTAESDDTAGATETKDIPEGATTVTFWNSWTGGDGDALQALVDKYNSENTDNIFVDMTRTTSFNDMLQTNLPTGEASSLILLNSNDFNRYGEYFVPMDDIWDNTSLKEADFSEAYMKAGHVNDALYGLPFQISTYMLYYNKDLLAEAGYSEKQVPKTFDEWTKAAEDITKLSSDDKPIYGSGLFYCYNGQNQAAIQRFGTDYFITGNETDGFKANLLDNQAFADAMIWMKKQYDEGLNPKEKDIDSMMAAGQIGLEINGGWLKGTLDASGINYGIARIPTVDGTDQENWSLGDVNCFYITSSASDEEKVAAEKFIEWWFTGNGLAASDVTQNVDYSSITPNAEWSISMCYLNAYIPTVESAEYQADPILTDLTPSDTAQVQMYAEQGTLFWSDVAQCQADFVNDWVFNGPTDPTYDDVQEFFSVYQDDLEQYISDYYG